jgi:C-terminal processing protease CtpA/Prc
VQGAGFNVTFRGLFCRFFWVLPLLGGITACASETGTLGAVLTERADGRLFVHDTPPGLAAERHGLVPGDEILLIDGRDVRTMSEHELYGALTGDVGATLKLTVVRGDDVFRVTLARTPAPQRSGARAAAN